METYGDSRVALEDIRAAAQGLNLSDRPLCIHASFRGFGGVVEGGPATVIDGLLAEGCTVMVPTFHGKLPALPSVVFERPEAVQGNHPICSFTAVGPMAHVLIEGQGPMNVYAPLRALAENDGLVVLMGVGLDKMTLLHLAEQMAGRNLFHWWRKRWCEIGGCSRGFRKLEPFLKHLYWQGKVGRCIWSIFPVVATLEVVERTIGDNPMITHCGDERCWRCNMAVKGGPQ